MMKSYICVVGGLGNQMFHVALSLALRQRGIQVYLNDFLAAHGQSHYGSELTRVFNVKIPKDQVLGLLIWSIRKSVVFRDRYPLVVSLFWKVLKLLKVQIVSDYLPSFTNCPEATRTIYYGRYQSEQYFDECVSTVRDIFKFDERKISDINKEMSFKIRSENSAFIHIRRGDYLLEKYKDIFGGICTVDYYLDAVKYLSDRTQVSHFYVFSDDIAWVKENLNIPNAIFVHWNVKQASWQDMYLMTCCKHGIVANSTFSWWGAWLINNPSKIIVCPSKYINVESSETDNFYPESWKKI